MKKALLLALALALLLGGCALDVVGNDAARALAEVRGLTGWEIAAPDGGARLEQTGSALTLFADAAPFVAAGLQTQEKTLVYQGFADRKSLGYHPQMDHYNYTLGGAAFEWAKDLAANDKDIVFVLDPGPLTAAGVAPEQVEGWAYAQVPVMADGREILVWKFLKAFNIK